MSVEPRDVVAPSDALAWVFPTGGADGYWATTRAQITAAYHRGDRMFPTELDREGRRWLRNVAEWTHLADYLALTNRVRSLAAVVDRVRAELEEDAEADVGARPSVLGDVSRPTERDDPPANAEPPPCLPAFGNRELPDPDDALTAITEIFERGTGRYRDAGTAMSGLNELWQRLEGEDRDTLRSYEEAANRNAELWAADRFRIGYALGASGILRDLL